MLCASALEVLFRGMGANSHNQPAVLDCCAVLCCAVLCCACSLQCPQVMCYRQCGVVVRSKSELAFVLPAALSLYRLKPNRPQPLASRSLSKTLPMYSTTTKTIPCPQAEVCKVPDGLMSCFSKMLPVCQQLYLRERGRREGGLRVVGVLGMGFGGGSATA